MPTGLTEGIPKGITFEEYAKRCARHMGTLVRLRDEPIDGPFPTKVEPSTYHRDAITSVKHKIEQLEELSDEALEEAARIWYQTTRGEYDWLIERSDETLHAYQQMRKRVEQYQPPTPHHTGFKQLMLDQIDRSIEFDCNKEYFIEARNKIKKLDGPEWKQMRLKKLKEDLEYHTREWKEEQDRVRRSNKWITEFLESLDSYEYIPEKTL